MTHYFDWTDKNIERLKKLWTDGYTPKQIMEALGISRGAVMGKLHRLGLHKRRPRQIKPKIKARREGRVRRQGERSGRMIENRINLPSQPLPPEKRVEEKHVFPLVHGTASLVARNDERQCWWPVGDPREADFHYCTNSKDEDARYCAEHTNLSRQKERGRDWYESREEWARQNPHESSARHILETLAKRRAA